MGAQVIAPTKKAEARRTVERYSLLANQLALPNGGNTIGRVFEQVEIAEEEIKKACKRWPRHALRIDRVFLSLPSPVLNTAPEKVFRAHCVELIERVRLGEDLSPGTNAEAVMTFSRASLNRPPGRDEAKAYALAYVACFGESVVTHSLISQDDGIPGEPARLVEEVRRKCAALAKRKSEA